MKLMHRKLDDAKYKSYGVRKIGEAKWKWIEDKRIAEYRQDMIDKAVEKILEDRKNHRRTEDVGIDNIYKKE